MPRNEDDRALAAVLDLMGQQLATIRALGGASGVIQAPTPPGPLASAPGPLASTLDGAAVAGQVRALVADIGGFRDGHVRDDHRLQEDLGFNSLMTGELMGRLRARFGEIGSDGLSSDPRVSEIAAHVASAGAGPARPSPAPSRPEPASSAPERRMPRRRESGDVETWEEYREIAGRLREGLQGEPSPYARTHEGMNRGTTRVGDRSVVNFAAFNYLGLSAEREVCEAAKKAIDRYGTSASATPLLLGETPLHHELAAEVASFLGTDNAIVFASGHQTNVGTIGHLFGADDLIVHDQYIHDSSVRGAMLSGAKYRSFPHNDVAALDRMLAAVRAEYRRVLICVEGIYSQDGDIVDLPAVIAVKKRHEAMLIVDEAHSIGVLGRTGAGVGEHFGADRRDVDLWMGTLSKALGSCGGYVAGSRQLIDYMRHTTPLFIFSTGISPANAAAALAAIRFVRAHPERVQRLAELASGFLEEARQYGFDVGAAAPGSPVVPIIVGAWSRAIHLSNELLERGINVMPIGYPAVAKDRARLRFFVNADHDPDELHHALEALRALTSGNGATARNRLMPLASRRAVAARSVETGAA
jgi:8-amino-7-oxononanoate synthase